MKPLIVWLFLVVLVLSAMGLLMVYETTSAEVIDHKIHRSLDHAFLKQLLHALLGVLCSFCIVKIGYERLLRYSFPILALLTFLLVLVLIPHVGTKLNGARRWLKIGHFSFQPSEFVKIMLPIAYIRFLELKEGKVDLKLFLKSLAIFFIPLFCIFIEPDNGTVAILMATLVALFFLSGIRFRYYGIPLLILGVVGGAVAMQLPYVKERLSVYVNPTQDLLGKGHQPHQAKIAAGVGGLYGLGLGNSLQKMSYLPEARSDYIAAIYAEECGFIGVVVLTTLYMGMTLIGFLIAFKTKKREGRLIVAILTFLLSIQAFINLGVVSGLLPSKGTNLPLFSHGGTSLIANFAIIAIIINVAYTSMKTSTIAGEIYEA